MRLSIAEYFPSVDHKLAVYYSDIEDNDKEHCHDFYELVIVRDGHGLHVINSQPHFIKKGDVFFINNNDYHFYDELGTLKLTNILINPKKEFLYLKNIDSLLLPLQASQFSDYAWLDNQALADSNKIVDTIFSAKQQNNIAMQEALFFQLVMNIICEPLIDRSSNTYKVHKLLHYLQNNCFSCIDWERLSLQFDIPQRTLFRNFKNITGMTPENYLQRLRLISARKKITETDIAITTIAFECGFNNSNHFTTAYKGIFGLTPSEQRKSNEP